MVDEAKFQESEFKPHCCWTEYRSKTLTKLAGGNARLGCYGLALTIFSLGILRDNLSELSFSRSPEVFEKADSKIYQVQRCSGGTTQVPFTALWRVQTPRCHTLRIRIHTCRLFYVEIGRDRHLSW